MTRVAVIGNAGGGKSTLCRQLSQARGLPYYAIDKMQWQPGWRLIPADEFMHQHDALLSLERWILDGFGPWESILRRFEAADTIIFVDHPLWLHYWWASKRQIKSVLWGRPDGPEGCPMLPVTMRLYKMMWRLHYDMRPKLLAAVEGYRAEKAVFHIRSPRALANFRHLYC